MTKSALQNKIFADATKAREWLEKALDDLESARVLAAAEHAANALYHCQQSAEKSLKAFLTWHDRPFRNTHDIEKLGDVCREIDGSLGALADEADVLSEYAWKLRYPGSRYKPKRKEVEIMLGVAAQVFREVQSRLPPDARHTEDHGDHEQ